jgi:hypothetical protein
MVLFKSRNKIVRQLHGHAILSLEKCAELVLNALHEAQSTEFRDPESLCQDSYYVRPSTDSKGGGGSLHHLA